jgi:hypothetical protein
MALGAQLPVRLEADVEERLQAIADRTGTSKSALIRLLAKTFTDHVAASGGPVVLPPDWQSLLKPSDGRSGTKPNSKGSEKATSHMIQMARKIRGKKP